MIPYELTIDKTTPDIFERVTSDAQLMARLGVVIDIETYSYCITLKVAGNSYCMIFHLSELEPDIYEVHMACPKDSVKAYKAMSWAGMAWVKETINPNAKALVTTCPKKLTKVFASLNRLGFVRVGDSKTEPDTHVLIRAI